MWEGRSCFLYVFKRWCTLVTNIFSIQVLSLRTSDRHYSNLNPCGSQLHYYRCLECGKSLVVFVRQCASVTNIFSIQVLSLRTSDRHYSNLNPCGSQLHYYRCLECGKSLVVFVRQCASVTNIFSIQVLSLRTSDRHYSNLDPCEINFIITSVLCVEKYHLHDIRKLLLKVLRIL